MMMHVRPEFPERAPRFADVDSLIVVSEYLPGVTSVVIRSLEEDVRTTGDPQDGHSRTPPPRRPATA